MLKGLKIMFVSCIAIGATVFAYQMITIQDVQADSQKTKTDVQSKATDEVKQLNNTQTNQSQETILMNSKEIGIEKAKQLALAKVNGKIVDIKSDDDDYNVYIEKDNYIYEIEVDRYHGVVDDIDKEKKPSSNAQIISQEQAKHIALTKVDGIVREIEYDNDDYQYDVKVYKDMIEYEIKIDAKSGGVLEIEKDD